MPSNADFVGHKLQWEPGQEGKGFIVRPTPVGLQNFPQLTNAQPLVWTWPTQGMEPIHDRMKTHTTYEVPQGMGADKSSYFHIQPDGGVYQVGSGRTLADEDFGTLRDADPRLAPVQQQPKVQTDSYGHGNRLLEILGAIRRGRWSEIPLRWRSNAEEE